MVGKRTSSEEMTAVKGTASSLSLTETTICSLANTGEIPGLAVGQGWRLRMDSCDG